MAALPYSITPLGNNAINISFGNVIDENINQEVYAYLQKIKEANISWILDLAPAYSSITVYYDAERMTSENLGKSAFKSIKSQVEGLLSKNTESVTEQPRRVKIPVCYSDDFGWDLRSISRQIDLPVEEVINLHLQKVYKVFMIGFLPGFPYMGTVNERIAIPRKSEPRKQVEAGSVGIAGQQTGIYSLKSPGGWQIIGRTPVKIFDKYRENPVLVNPGDQVEFYSITRDEFDNY